MTIFSACSKEDGPENGGKQDGPSEILVCAGSYNIRMSGLDSGNNAWDIRKHRLVKSIIDNDFDIFGVQEFSSVSQKELPALLKEAGHPYGMFVFSPYSQEGSGDKAQAIFYKEDKFTLSSRRFFWASDTPTQCTVNDTGTNGSYRRGGCCAIVTSKENPDIKFFFMVTHACLNSLPNSKYAYVYAEQEARFNPEGLPSFFVGDMNAKPEAPASVEYRKTWKDVRLFLPSAGVQGPAGTFNGFDTDRNMENASRIDFIYFKGDGVIPVKYVCNNTLYDGAYASDHLPVYAEFRISSGR